MTRNNERIEAIEDRLHDHERELGRTLETIREKLSSREVVGEVYDRARASGYLQALGRALRDNPLPTVLAGICGAWLAKSAAEAVADQRKLREREEEKREGPTLSQVALADTAAGGRPGEERASAEGESPSEDKGGRVVLPPSSQPDV
jgi:hypothetical protein